MTRKKVEVKKILVIFSPKLIDLKASILVTFNINNMICTLCSKVL